MMKILFITRNYFDYMDQTCWASWVSVLTRKADVKFHGPNFPAFKDRVTFESVIRQHYGDDEPDVILWYSYTGNYTRVDEPDIPKVNFIQNGKAYLNPPYVYNWINRLKFDLVLFRFWSATKSLEWRKRLKANDYSIEQWVMYDIMEEYRKNLSCPMVSFPHCINPEMFKDYGYEKSYDLFLLQTRSHGFYPIRNFIFKLIGRYGVPELRGVKVFAPPHLPYHERISEIYEQQKKRGCVYGADLAKAMNRCKIAVTDGSMFGVAVPRFYEAMATKCLILAPLPDDAEDLHFIDGYNIVDVNEDNLKEKLIYYLKHDDERERIVRNAYKTVMTHHTGEVRVNQLLRILEGLKK